jgi:GT2 family glycosyltransferase
MAEAPVSVVIPTVGRPAKLEECLASLRAGRSRPDEVLVVDQSAASVSVPVTAAFRDIGARTLKCLGTGRAAAVNHGFREARHATVLSTDDDITVAQDWVAVGRQVLEREPSALHTGRVLPVGDGRRVPSTITDPWPRVHRAARAGSVLFAGNMACDRQRFLGAGAFDPFVRPASEDNEFCFRWLRAGGEVHYHPSMTVWHHDWRTPDQMREQYARYARGDGVFYAKHLLRGDPLAAWFLGRDVIRGLRAVLLLRLRGDGERSDPGLGIPRGLPLGLADGLRVYGPWGRWRRPRGVVRC